MVKIIKDLIYSIFALLISNWEKTALKNNESTYYNTTSKKVLSNSATLDLTATTDKNREKTKEDVQSIIKENKNNPQELLRFVAKNGTKVYKIPFANKILNLMQLEEGLIPAQSGLKAFLLNLLLAFLGKVDYISIYTEPMFILRPTGMENYRITQQFYKWYSMKMNLPGFDAESQDNLQKFLYPANDEKLNELSISEILGLKEAIARDIESINFVIELAKSTDCSKEALKKIKVGGASV